MDSVLVAYATNYGSTREVAEKVAEILAERGVDASVSAASDVDVLGGYSAVVVGGALYFFRWHKDARRFLSRHRKALKDVPVAVFGMGPFNDTTEEFASARKHLDRSLGKHTWLSPVSVNVFGGCFDPTGPRFPHNNPAMKQMPASDIRDWDAIRAWAESLPQALGLEKPPAGS